MRWPTTPSMGHCPTLCRKTVAYIDITSSFTVAKSWISALDQAPIGHEAHAMGLIRQVGPDSIVEDVSLDSFYAVGQGDNSLSFPPVFESRSVDGHAGDVI